MLALLQTTTTQTTKTHTLLQVLDVLPGVDPRDSLTEIITELNITIPDTYVPTDVNYLQVGGQSIAWRGITGSAQIFRQ